MPPACKELKNPAQSPTLGLQVELVVQDYYPLSWTFQVYFGSFPSFPPYLQHDDDASISMPLAAITLRLLCWKPNCCYFTAAKVLLFASYRCHRTTIIIIKAKARTLYKPLLLIFNFMLIRQLNSSIFSTSTTVLLQASSTIKYIISSLN